MSAIEARGFASFPRGSFALDSWLWRVLYRQVSRRPKPFAPGFGATTQKRRALRPASRSLPGGDTNYQVLSDLHPPLPAVVQVRVGPAPLVFVIVKSLPDFEWPTIA
jgi:hypothetical protein